MATTATDLTRRLVTGSRHQKSSRGRRDMNTNAFMVKLELMIHKKTCPTNKHMRHLLEWSIRGKVNDMYGGLGSQLGVPARTRSNEMGGSCSTGEDFD